MRCAPILLGATVLQLVACAPPDGEAAPDTESSSVEAGEPELQFAFAVIADPHVGGEGEHADRLAAAVAWLNDHQQERSLELVLVCGDIGWNEGLPAARDALDLLRVPYAPVTGDNEVHIGDEAAFHQVFADAYDTLAASTDGWRKAPLPVAEPELGRDVWLENYAFEHRGVRFVGLDWASRSDDFIESEMGTLHDFEGGTLAFLADELEDAEQRADESIVFASHIPMLMAPGAFDVAELSVLDGLTVPVQSKVAASFAGHWHTDYEGPDQTGGYDAFIVDATWDDDVVLWMVDVSFDGRAFSYAHESIVVPW